MASAAPRKNVRKTLSLEKVVHGVLESDEDESLSEFIESESELGDFEDEDGNQLFFIPAANVRLSSLQHLPWLVVVIKKLRSYRYHFYCFSSL